ncbi:MAG TPA: hypothetical protein VKB20_01990 [Steroidobacteraceae bacterium]|nr:hypothetical protein [Steroidobacteraceae bacterium]
MLKPRKSVALLLAIGGVLTAPVPAQVPPISQVHTVAAPDRAVPVEESFDITTAGTYQITLTDLGALLPTPAPLGTVKLAVTSGNSIVGTPLSAPGSTSFSAQPGTYIIHVVGEPGAVPGSGPFGITVSDPMQNPIASFSGSLALPQASVPNNVGVLTGSFTVPTSGSYQVSLTDLQLPQVLNALTLAITIQGGALVTTLPAAGNTSVALQSGLTYDIFAIGQSTATPSAGLYGVNVSPAGGGTPVYGNAIPVGAVALVGTPTLKVQNYTLKLSDLTVPANLSQLGAALTLLGQSVAQLNGAGTTSIAGTVNTYQAFALALPSGSGTGGYAMALQPASGVAPLDVARAVSAPGGAVLAYSYDAQVPSSGAYTLELADFALPAQFASLSAAAVQSGSVLGSPLHAAGSQSVNAAAGPLSLLVFAQPGASGGLFGVDLTASGNTNPAFAATQGVGQLFSAQQLNIVAGGTYKVTVSDVGFPAPFQNLAVVVTRGADQLGSIFVSGNFSFVATPGNYFVNVIAEPAGSDEAGTYALDVASAPPAPAVSLSSDRSSVSSGGTVNLIWSSQNATICMASGGWSGNQPLNGTKTTAAITATTTFTLTCKGAGDNTATKSVQVTVSAGGGGGGGGAVQPDLLALLLTLVLLRAVAVTRSSREVPTVRDF